MQLPFHEEVFTACLHHLEAFLLSYLKLLLLLEEIVVTFLFLKQEFSLLVFMTWKSFFFSCVLLPSSEEMSVVCLFLFGELHLLTTDRWRTLFLLNCSV